MSLYRRPSPSPERFPIPDPELEDRRSDSSHSRSRSRTKKRTVQSQSRSRESSQKLRLKEMAPTYYQEKYNSGHEARAFEAAEDRAAHRLDIEKNNLESAQQNASPSLSEIEGIYRGAEPENFGSLSKKYSERYPMDLNDEDISVMKKFIHHKKDELPSELFYMDVETFKKLYVQNRVMEMKREASRSRRSSLSSNTNEQDIHERNTASEDPLKNNLAQDPRRNGDREPYNNSTAPAGVSSPRSYHQARALNEGSLRFHNHGVGPYYRAFSWFKVPTSKALLLGSEW